MAKSQRSDQGRPSWLESIAAAVRSALSGSMNCGKCCKRNFSFNALARRAYTKCINLELTPRPFSTRVPSRQDDGHHRCDPKQHDRLLQLDDAWRATNPTPVAGGA